MVKLLDKLNKIQVELNAPKSQYNGFGKYYYRNCEDILQAVKPLLTECIITIDDEMILVGERVYVKATASITDAEGSISVNGWAREALSKRGMDESQITGAASSYARKYALNGLLLIDDNKDADHAPQKKDDDKERLIAHNNAVRDNIETITAVKLALGHQDWDVAAEAMQELGEDERQAIGLAATKGGIFDLADTAAFKTTEYAEARTRYFEGKK